MLGKPFVMNLSFREKSNLQYLNTETNDNSTYFELTRKNGVKLYLNRDSFPVEIDFDAFRGCGHVVGSTGEKGDGILVESFHVELRLKEEN